MKIEFKNGSSIEGLKEGKNVRSNRSKEIVNYDIEKINQFSKLINKKPWLYVEAGTGYKFTLWQKIIIYISYKFDKLKRR